MRWRYLLPAVYLALAIYVWIDFAGTNPDGLANVGLMAVVLPSTILGLLIGWLIGEQHFVLLPQRFGYLADHALFYAPSVAVLALVLWWIGRRIDRRGRKS